MAEMCLLALSFFSVLAFTREFLRMRHCFLLYILFLPLVNIFLFLSCAEAEISGKIGVNYGQLGDNLPSPRQSIDLIKSMKAARVKLYDANPEILNLLSGTNIHVSIMVPNQEILSISSNQTLADQWVRNYVLSHYPQTMIRFIVVGNELLSHYSDRQIWPHIVPAMRRIKKSLKANNIGNIKIGTSLAMDLLESSFPPSSGMFRSDIQDTVMVPLLQFLNGTNSFFFLDVYPYLAWSANPSNISLDYALFRGVGLNYTDPVSNLTYTNLLDQMLDSVIFAMEKLGYPNIRLLISETGWPNAGDVDQPGANVYNAAIYNRNLIKKMTAKPAVGTPARPGMIIPTFIFALYNENQKRGPGTERHWGLLDCRGKPVYGVDLTGEQKEPEDDHQLPMPQNNKPYKGKIWCVVAGEVNQAHLGLALRYACSQGNGTCDALMPGKECYEPVSLLWHASYAFSSYWAKFRSMGADCYFNGLAVQTTVDPSECSLFCVSEVSPFVDLLI